MKYFFILIVILNLLLFFWQYKTQPHSKQASKASENVEQIQLMSEIDKGSQTSDADSEQQ